MRRWQSRIAGGGHAADIDDVLECERCTGERRRVDIDIGGLRERAGRIEMEHAGHRAVEAPDAVQRQFDKSLRRCGF